MPDIARHLYVRGHVQGVFFRDWTVETARTLSLRGWVRNLPDGRVEIVALGAPEQIDQFVARCHEGPPKSVVEDVLIEDLPATAIESIQEETFHRR